MLYMDIKYIIVININNYIVLEFYLFFFFIIKKEIGNITTPLKK